MFTISAEVYRRLIPIRYGATQPEYADHRDLARGFSAGIDRPGIRPHTIETVEGPQYPDAIVLTDAAGNVLHRFVDGVDTAHPRTAESAEDAPVMYRHPEGLVWLVGSN